jgi:DNA-binding MarR family transcriptional regulator
MEAMAGSARNERVPSPDEELVRKMMYLTKLMGRYYSAESMRRGHVGNPMRGQGRVLLLLKDRPGTSQRELAYLLGMRPQSLSELLGKLEEKGLVSRSKSPEDARVTVVSLTDKGMESVPDIGAEQTHESPLDALTSDEKASFEATIEKVSDAYAMRLADLGIDLNDPHGRSFAGGRDDCRGGHRGQGGRGNGECCGQGQGRRRQEGCCHGGEGHGRCRRNQQDAAKE